MASKFIKLISNRQRPAIFDDGTQSRDFIPQAGFRINSTYVVPMQIGIVEQTYLHQQFRNVQKMSTATQD
jgi:hypothetical protein